MNTDNISTVMACSVLTLVCGRALQMEYMQHAERKMTAPASGTSDPPLP